MRPEPASGPIALVTLSTPAGDAPSAVTGLAASLDAAGHQVQVVTEELAGQVGPDLSGRVRRCSADLARAWAHQPPGIVHTRDAVTGLAALSAAPAGALLVHETRGRLTGPAGGDDLDLLRLELLLLREVGAVIVRSHHELEALSARGIPRPRLHLVPCGVDTAAFAPVGPAFPRSARPRVVTVAEDLGDGVDRVMHALRGSNDIELVVAGGLPRDRQRHDAGARRLRELAARCGSSGRVELVGHVDHAELPALLRSADVVAQAGRSASGTAVVEAMATGRPVVALATPGAADAVVERTTGVLVDPRDDRALRRELLELLDDPLRQEGYGLAGVQRAAARHDWSVVGACTARAYGLRPAGAEVQTSSPA